MILAGVATYFNSRASVARQSAEAAANPQTAMMNKLALYVFPLGVVVGGPFLPLAIILYWFANNIWTFAQQHYVFGMIEKEEEAKKQEAIERRAANAPAPGAKPKRSPKAAPGGNGSATDATDGDDAGAADPGASDGQGTGAQAEPDRTNPAGRNSSAGNRTPRPGARPKRRKR
jgi:YidC/Oxa1 family membrane protein insertase